MWLPCYRIPKSGLFKNPDAKIGSAELRGFKITRTGDPDDPEVELQFKAFCPFNREFWAWLGEMCGEEVYMNFPTALAKSPQKPAEASGALPLTAEPSEGAGAPAARQSGPKPLGSAKQASAGLN